MIPKGEMLDHMNDVQLFVAIFLPQRSKNFYFYHSLLVKSRLKRLLRIVHEMRV